MSTDASLSAVSGIRSALERHSRLALGSPEAVEVAVDKSRTLSVADSLGVPTPISLAAHSREEVPNALSRTGLPCVIKPLRSWDSASSRPEQGVRLVARFAADAHAAADAVGELADHGGAILQSYAPGQREAIHLLRCGGAFVAQFAAAASRTWPPLGGSSVMRWSIPLPTDTADYARALIDAIDLDGYSEVEFRRDASGVPRLLEINARFSQSVELPILSGVDFPSMAFVWAAGLTPPEVSAYQTGVRLSWFGGEVRLIRRSIRGVRGLQPGFPASLVDLVKDYAHRPHLDGGHVDEMFARFLGNVSTIARRRLS